jgi:hypothetical protein
VFGIVVVVAVQSVFRLEMHQNEFFKRKIIFNIGTLKQSENIKNISFKAKKKFKI